MNNHINESVKSGFPSYQVSPQNESVGIALPIEVACEVLGYLSTPDVISASQVDTFWREASFTVLKNREFPFFKEIRKSFKENMAVESELSGVQKNEFLAFLDNTISADRKSLPQIIGFGPFFLREIFERLKNFSIEDLSKVANLSSGHIKAVIDIAIFFKKFDESSQLNFASNIQELGRILGEIGEFGPDSGKVGKMITNCFIDELSRRPGFSRMFSALSKGMHRLI